MSLQLSVLDQSPVSEGMTRATAITSTVRLATALDNLGYSRFWVAEHHDSPGFAGTAPEILVASILDNTEQLRVGSGGVLLPRYSARKVAEVFSVLSALHPGRVDLGVGRAGGPRQAFGIRWLNCNDDSSLQAATQLCGYSARADRRRNSPPEKEQALRSGTS